MQMALQKLLSWVLIRRDHLHISLTLKLCVCACVLGVDGTAKRQEEGTRRNRAMTMGGQREKNQLPNLCQAVRGKLNDIGF